MKNRHNTAGFETRTRRTAMNDFATVKDLAHGRWDSVIGTLYPALAPALKRPGQSRCACPIHGTAKANGDGFRVFRDFAQTGGGVCNTCGSFAGGVDLIMFLEGCDARGALQILKGHFGIDDDGGVPRTPRKIEAPAVPAVPDYSDEDIAKRERVLKRIWAESQPLASLPDDHQAIRYYTETRGVSSTELIKQQRMIRFHPSLYYRTEEETPRNLPALVSMFHGSCGTPLGVHRTFLASDAPRKADVTTPKKVLRRHDVRLNGGIRLFGREGFSGHINICEGKETGLAISYATGKSLIAATTTSLMAAWEPLKGTHHVTIWADADETKPGPTGKPIKAGAFAAYKLHARLVDLGIKARVLVPDLHEGKKNDWADVLLRDGPESIAQLYSLPFG